MADRRPPVERPDPVAVWITAPRQVEVRCEERTALGPTDVRIAALASGVSAGSELLVYRGLAPKELEPDLPTVAGSFGLPVKFGYANVGRVIEVGREATRPALDEVVFVHHPHQSEYVVPAEAPLTLPAGIPAEVGVFTANLETAVTIVLDAAPRLREAVLVVGQGIVGLLVTMLLRRTGAHPIIVVDAYEARRRAALQIGADAALAPGDALVDEARHLTRGRGVDVAIEVSGEPGALQPCLDAVAFGGAVVIASWYGTRPVTLDLGAAFHRRRIRLVGTQVSTLDPALSARWTRDRRTAVVADLLRELPLAALVSHRVPIHEAERAYRLLDEHPAEALQVVLVYDGDAADRRP